ncbi:aspartate/glutamate racemase family protein [Salipiger abyssi]|uniref:maleate cis-trans isomerase family protein n=1 Tax=Salipiger abyssi TaxID=1250539 RepID=UPI001A8E18C9|nr:aspartate/glutamate racemase family protein [Salipiger abyssi]MBN9887012.1 aspartate/glutamate racemase family protein [Salipiger abyssi]
MKHADLRRIGVVGPAGNMALEWELPRHLPEGFAINHARAVRPGGTALTAASLGEMGRNAIDAAQSLMRTRPELILYACTSGSFVDGPGSEDAVAQEITAVTGVPALTASRAVRSALAELKAKRVFLLTPYPEAINQAEIAFLTAAGHEVTGCVAHTCDEARPIGAVDSRETVALLMQQAEIAAASDTVFLSCTNLLTFDIIPELEDRLGKPVISSNLALLRAALCETGAPLPLTGPGALMRLAPDPATAPNIFERTD